MVLKCKGIDLQCARGHQSGYIITNGGVRCLARVLLTLRSFDVPVLKAKFKFGFGSVKTEFCIDLQQIMFREVYVFDSVRFQLFGSENGAV